MSYNSLLDLRRVCEISFFRTVLSVFNMAAALDLHPNCKASTEDPEKLVDFARHVLSSK